MNIFQGIEIIEIIEIITIKHIVISIPIDYVKSFARRYCVFAPKA